MATNNDYEVDMSDVVDIEIDGVIYQLFHASRVAPSPPLKLNNVIVAYLDYTYDFDTNENTYEIRWI